MLSFPVRDGDRSHRTGDHAAALVGGIGFTGAGRNITWTGLRIDGDRGVVTAVLSGGDRAKVLRFAGGGDRHRRTGGGMTLVLTGAGAASLNRAAAGAPFDAGDAFAGGDDCR